MTQQTETTITMATASDAGCWIDGHWGQYATARLVEIAQAHGYANDVITDIAGRHMWRCEHPTADYTEGTFISDDDHETLIEASDEIEAWMNEHVAPEGYSFGWFDGEFFLSRNESIGDGTSWEEVDDLA